MDRVKEVIEATKQKIVRGNAREQNQTFLHTGPHHDDIMLGIFPCIIPTLREASNRFRLYRLYFRFHCCYQRYAAEFPAGNPESY